MLSIIFQNTIVLLIILNKCITDLEFRLNTNIQLRLADEKTDASLANAFNPIVAFLATYLILGEAPTLAQYLGGGVILGGIMLSQMGWRKRSAFTAADQASHPQKMDSGVGFKGI